MPPIQAESATTLPSGPLIGPYPAFQKILQGALETVLFKNGDPDAALSKAQKDATALLKDYSGG